MCLSACRAANVMNEAHVKEMCDDPIILAMANPIPEIMPDIAKAAGRGHRRHRAERLPESSEQRPRLPRYFSRRARRESEADFRTHENRSGPRAGQCGPESYRRHDPARPPRPEYRADGRQSCRESRDAGIDTRMTRIGRIAADRFR